MTIFPAFLRALGANNIEIGLLAVITSAGFALPQLFVAPFTERLRRKSPFVLFGTIWERLPSGALALLALFLAVPHPTLTLWLALALVAVEMLVGGVLMPAWLDLVARAISARSRGRFFGWSSGAAGALGFLGSIESQRLLDQNSFPVGYADCFTIAFVLLIISFVFLALNREVVPTEAHVTRPSAGSYGGELVWVVRQRPDFRAFLGWRCLAAFSGAASGFYTVYALAKVPDAKDEIGLLTGVLLVATTVANIVLGHLADRLGHRATLALGQALLLGAMVAALVGASMASMELAFVLLGAGTAAMNVSLLPMTIDFAPPESRPTYIGMASFASVPFSIGGPLVGGFLADQTGYAATYLLYLATGIVAFCCLIVGVRTPNSVHHRAVGSDPASPAD